MPRYTRRVPTFDEKLTAAVELELVLRDAAPSTVVPALVVRHHIAVYLSKAAVDLEHELAHPAAQSTTPRQPDYGRGPRQETPAPTGARLAPLSMHPPSATGSKLPSPSGPQPVSGAKLRLLPSISSTAAGQTSDPSQHHPPTQQRQRQQLEPAALRRRCLRYLATLTVESAEYLDMFQHALGDFTDERSGNGRSSFQDLVLAPFPFVDSLSVGDAALSDALLRRLLTAEGRGGAAPHSPFPSLSTLSLSSWPKGTTPGGVFDALQRCTVTTITELRFVNVPFVNAAFIGHSCAMTEGRWSAALTQSLRSLTLFSCFGLCDTEALAEAVTETAAKFHSAVKIGLPASDDFPGGALRALRHLPHLESLRLKSCDGISGVGLAFATDQLRELSISWCKNLTADGVVAAQLLRSKLCTQNNTSGDQTSADQGTDSGNANGAPLFPNLRSLVFDRPTFGDGYRRVLEALIPLTPAVDNTIVGGVSGATALAAARPLESFTCRAAKDMADDGLLAAVAAANPRLADLRIDVCSDLPPNALVTFAAAAATAGLRLRTLHISPSGKCYDVAVLTAFTACPALRYLTELRMSNAFTDHSDEQIAAFLATVPSLTVLDASYNQHLADKSLTALAAAADGPRPMRDLDVGHCKATTDAGAAIVAEAMPQLQRFNVGWSYHVTAQGLRAAFQHHRRGVEIGVGGCSKVARDDVWESKLRMSK